MAKKVKRQVSRGSRLTESQRSTVYPRQKRSFHPEPPGAQQRV
jgi:hypothetical protein